MSQLINAILFACLATTLAGAEFDLNQLPDDMGDTDANQLWVEIPSTTTLAPAVKTPAPGRDKQRVRQCLPELYAKIQRLFTILRVCDVEDFDLSAINIPSSFVTENKAIIALSRAAKINAIPKTFKSRWNRVNANCKLLGIAVQAKKDNAMGMASQMSGGDVQDTLERFNMSPLESLKDKLNSVRNQAAPTLQPIAAPKPKPLVTRIEPVYESEDVANQRVQTKLINFL